MQQLRRILTGLVVAMVALLPVVARAMPVDAMASASTPAAVVHHHAAAAHADHAAMGCAGHHGHDRGTPASRHPCGDCAMACCSPAIVDLVAPAPVGTAEVSFIRRTLPSADRRYADASPVERLRPPIRL